MHEWQLVCFNFPPDWLCTFFILTVILDWPGWCATAWLHICRVADDERLVYKLLIINLLPLFFFWTKELERYSSKSFLSTMMHDPARFSEPNTRTHVWVAQSVDCARAVQFTDCPRKARIHALRSAIHGLSPILGLRTTYTPRTTPSTLVVGDIEKSERRLSRTNYHDYHDYCQLKIIVLFQIVWQKY